MSVYLESVVVGLASSTAGSSVKITFSIICHLDFLAVLTSLLVFHASKNSKITTYQLEKHREDRPSSPIVQEKLFHWFGCICFHLDHASLLSQSQSSGEHSTSSQRCCSLLDSKL